MGNNIFIVWGRETELSRCLAETFSADIKQIYIKKAGNLPLPAFLRYPLQAAVTLWILFKNRPKMVIVQNPPIFAPLSVLIYCSIAGAKLLIDSHTAAFLDKKWTYFHWLFKFTSKKARFNTCHNYKNLEILHNWEIERCAVMPFSNPVYDFEKLSLPLIDTDLEDKIKESALPIFMVNRFANDDDWQTVIETAKLLPSADFFITGDYKSLLKQGRNKIEVKQSSFQTNLVSHFSALPENVILTGYLQHEEFLKLMNRCKVALAFTLRQDTLLWSVREIIALRKPFVATDSEVMRHYYGEVGLFAKSDPKEINEKIAEALEREKEIRGRMKKFLIKDNGKRAEKIKLIKSQLK